MNLAIFTLYEGSYHYGVAALVNSAIHSGFRGRFFAGYRDAIPRWAKRLGADGDRAVEVGGLTLQFFPCRPDRHLGYHKPFAALQLLDHHPDLEGIVYADPDVVFLASWRFLEDWIRSGVALCEDSNFPRVHENHPWRREWRRWIANAGLEVKVTTNQYVNSGFFAVQRKERHVVDAWVALTKSFEAGGGDTARFHAASREQPVVTDQDLLAAALMATECPLSVLGPEGMGFNGHFLVLSHAIESPKPWDTYYLAHALQGVRPSQQSYWYERFAEGPLHAVSSTVARWRRVERALGRAIGRLYSR